MIQRVLVANRGEIARRVFRTCRAMGIKTVAVYSEADRDAPHVREADRVVAIGPAPASESYLNIANIIDAARGSDADALHPGYGFLSENPALAEACEAAGMTFVGPTAAVMRRMGSKIGARQAAVDAGVPVVPGATPRSQSDADVAAAADEVGYPVLLKAAGGGGGKGMRAVRRREDLVDAIASARQEAGRAFGRTDLYVERLIDRPRHIEVQVLGDRHGNVLHLFERDCTLQRRHQKVIEEAPAFTITPTLRARLTDAAVAVARQVGYVNAGTVEMLVDHQEGRGDDARFYFLELNMRLQVEHPITEAVTGLDLVKLQLQVAAGEPLPFAQGDLNATGHAIECRIYAEDSRRLLPQSGRLLRYREPSGDGIRVDSGVVEGQHITVHYDPLLAKLITQGATRDEARARMNDALGRYEILGVHHNISFLRALMARAEVIDGTSYTTFIEEHLSEVSGEPPDALRRTAMAIAALASSTEQEPAASTDATAVDPWTTIGPLRW